MKTQHFESTLGVLLKVPGHVSAESIYMFELFVSSANKKLISSLGSFWIYWLFRNAFRYLVI